MDGRLPNAAARHFWRDRYLLLIFLPPLAYYLVFQYAPMVGVLIAFKRYEILKGIWGSPWAGLTYFRKYLSDPYFWRVARNTVLLNIYSLFWAFPAPVVLALLLNEVRSRRFRRLTQTVTYLPHFISTVVVVGMITNFLATGGVANRLITALGGQAISFLVRPEWFRTIYISSGIWQEAGWGSIIYMSALAAIHPELYEAALVDGANRWQRMLHITLPGISSTVVVMFILQLGRIMDVGFEKVFLLYNGATYETADVISTYVYRVGLVGADFSYGTAVDLFKSLIGLVFVTAANAASRRIGETSLW